MCWRLVLVAGQFHRALFTVDPHHAAGLNNYANLLIDRGCAAAITNARAAIEALERHPGRDGRYRVTVEDTLSRARELGRNALSVPAGCPPLTADGSADRG